MRKMMASLSASALLVAGLASAAPAQVTQDGLVNVNVGDVTILEDVNVAVAANLVANICANVDADVILGVLSTFEGTAETGDTMQVCRLGRGQGGGQTINIEQN